MTTFFINIKDIPFNTEFVILRTKTSEGKFGERLMVCLRPPVGLEMWVDEKVGNIHEKNYVRFDADSRLWIDSNTGMKRQLKAVSPIQEGELSFVVQNGDGTTTNGYTIYETKISKIEPPF